MAMTNIKMTVASMLVLAGLAACATESATPSIVNADFDGSYNADVIALGTCSSSSVQGIEVAIKNGQLSGGGQGWRVNGKISPQGEVSATASGQASIPLRGRLSGGQAAGDWNGGGCTGTWVMMKK